MRPEVQSVSRARRPRRFLSAGVVVAAVLGPVLPAGAQAQDVEVGPASVAEQDRAVFAALTLSVTGAPAALRPPAAQPVCYPFRISYGDSRSTADRGDVWIVEGRDLDRQIEVGWFHVTVDPSGVGVGGLASFTNVVVAGDDEDEPDEAFVVSVGTGGPCPAGGTVPTFPFGTELGAGAVTIADDDATVPGVAAGISLRVFEPPAPEAVVVLELPLTGEAAERYCYAYQIAVGRGTATVGTDLDYVSGGAGRFVTVRGSPLAVSRDVKLYGDGAVEDPETFYLDVFAGVSGSSCAVSPSAVPIAQVEVVIVDDDDPLPRVQPVGLAVTETDADFVVLLELSLDGEAAAAVCYPFAVVAGQGTASLPADFRGGPGAFVAAAGETAARSRDLTIVGDDLVEEDETFFLEVYGGISGTVCAAPSGAIAVSTVQVTITDDDEGAPGAQAATLEVAETDADFVALLELPLDAAAPAAVCYPFAVVAGRGTASSSADFGGGPGAFVAAAGETAARSRDLTIVGDDLAEDDETFFLEVYAGVSGTACTVPSEAVAVVTVQVIIVDDDEDAPGPGAGAFEVVETDVDAVAVLQMELDGAASDTRCYPFRVAYARSTAGREDARLVEAGGLRDVEHGRFVVQAGSSMAVSSNLLVVGDDVVEGPESLHLDLYAPGPPGAGACAPAGVPVRGLVVTIVDDDEVAGIASVEVDGGLDGLVREGDGGERERVRVVVRFARRLTEPVTVRYGSVADGLARGAGPKQDVETVRERSVRIDVGQIAVRLHVATVIGDDRVEAVEDFGVWVAVDRYAAETRGVAPCTDRQRRRRRRRGSRGDPRRGQRLGDRRGGPGHWRRGRGLPDGVELRSRVAVPDRRPAVGGRHLPRAHRAGVGASRRGLPFRRGHRGGARGGAPARLRPGESPADRSAPGLVCRSAAGRTSISSCTCSPVRRRRWSVGSSGSRSSTTIGSGARPARCGSGRRTRRRCVRPAAGVSIWWSRPAGEQHRSAWIWWSPSARSPSRGPRTMRRARSASAGR